MPAITIRQTSLNAALLVAFSAIILWFIFNAFFDAYPPRIITTHQTAAPVTPSAIEELGYPYHIQP